ncbi:Protein kinase-like domain [Phytophthora cactorum]|nr:Protein kinase-like domain [Phytophthora cactorum]
MAAACSLVAEFMIPELGEAITEALGNVFEFIQEMKENEEICRRVYERMKFVNEELYKITDETVLRQNRVLFMYGRTISDFLTFLKRQSQKSLIKRLASNRKVVDAIQDFHSDMDELFKLLNIAHMAEMAKWKQEWEEDRKRIHHQMAEILANGQSIHAEIQNSGATLKEGLAMIKYELEHKKEQNDPEQLKLMHKAFKKVVSTSKAKVPVVPEWFISSDDVEFDAKDQFDCGSYGSVHRGVWGKEPSPECLMPMGESDADAAHNPRFASDVYSFGMCIIEAFSDEPPYALDDDDTILEKMFSGEGYPRPEGLKDEEWELVQRLTDPDWEKRIGLSAAIDELQRFAEREKDAHQATQECPSCSMNVPAGFKFCGKCGSPLGNRLQRWRNGRIPPPGDGNV